MFSLLKHILWLLHIAAIAYFVMKYVGYDLNWHYFDSRKADCQTELAKCRENLIRTGIDGAKKTCDWKCTTLDPKLFIKKKVSSDAPPESTTSPATLPEGATMEAL